jgi:hypothetical protein
MHSGVAANRKYLFAFKPERQITEAWRIPP